MSKLILMILSTLISLIIIVTMTSPIWLSIVILFTELSFIVGIKILVSVIMIGFGLYYLSKIIDIVDD